MESALITGGAGFIGSNLALELERRYPDIRVTIVDDFRSGEFSNLIGFRGDLVAQDLASLDLLGRFQPGEFRVVFHLASITDTTVTDARQMIWSNVEGFRRVAEFARLSQTPLVYASSAATYGVCHSGRMREDQAARPANVYGFSKALLENLARRYADTSREWRVVGLRYFNVYGPGESHKGAAASMIYQLAEQIRAGKRPRIFKHGEQARDFVYVKDVVEATLLAAETNHSGVYNVGSGRPTSFNEVIALLNKALGTDRDPDYFDNPYPFYQPHTEADVARARAELGYVPKYPIDQGIAEYAKQLMEADMRQPELP
ncbi:ADP-glyceromanno-heptose 6-epimerase [Candidatus Methylomirabilis sp.]|uniref:ADP-glyceromanno-heptose 6-epimerase n=1 Tax=Candidatus Methylomirabilis sp. TaxID=2032687 RepID=UPI002A5FEA58|nr:ADP-glyceromanno-heptose 6-epimerase [Candidatus Methylomirabilis sp.]